MKQSIAAPSRDMVTGLPKIEVEPAVLESIYPGEPESVEAGITFGCLLVWGPRDAADAFTEGSDEIARAIRRFIAN